MTQAVEVRAHDHIAPLSVGHDLSEEVFFEHRGQIRDRLPGVFATGVVGDGLGCFQIRVLPERNNHKFGGFFVILDVPASIDPHTQEVHLKRSHVINQILPIGECHSIGAPLRLHIQTTIAILRPVADGDHRQRQFSTVKSQQLRQSLAAVEGACTAEAAHGDTVGGYLKYVTLARGISRCGYLFEGGASALSDPDGYRSRQRLIRDDAGPQSAVSTDGRADNVSGNALRV